MSTKIVSFSLILLMLFSGSIRTAQAQQGPADESEQKRIEKVRDKVYRIAANPKATAIVRMKDGRKLKGNITKAEDDSFVLTDPKINQSRSFSYADVVEVKKGGMSKAAKYGIGIALAAGIVVLVLTAPRRGLFDGFCPLGCPR